MVRLLATGEALTMLMARGFGVHVTPGMLVPQVTFTMPVNPPLGVTVMFDIPLPPAATVTAAPLRVNVPPLVTVNVTPLLAVPPTVTTTLPVVAPVGTGATMLVALQVDGVAAVPLNLTVLVPCVAPKFVPVIVTDVPTGPDVGFRLVMVGALELPVTVIVAFPAPEDAEFE